MKKHAGIVIIAVAALMAVVWLEIGDSWKSDDGLVTNNQNDNSGSVGLANPASVNCADKGGSLVVKKNDNGGEYGICTLASGAMCEEWSYYRGECSASDSFAYMESSKKIAEEWIKVNSMKYLKDGHSLEFIKTEGLDCLYCFEYYFKFKTGVGPGKEEHQAQIRVEKGKISRVTMDNQAQELNGEVFLGNTLSYIFSAAPSLPLKAYFDNAESGWVKYASKNNKNYYKIEAILPIVGDGLYRAWLIKASSTEFLSVGQLKYLAETKRYILETAIDKNKIVYDNLVITKQAGVEDTIPGEKVLFATLPLVNKYQVEVK